MTQIHSCRSPSTFRLPRKLHFHSPRLTAWKAYGYWKVEVNTSLVRHHLARWTSLFLCHFFHERRQRHNLLDCPTGSESSQFNVKMIQFFENYCHLMFLFLLGPLSYWKLFSPVVWFLMPRVQTLSLMLKSIHWDGWMNRILKLATRIRMRNEAGTKPCAAETLTMIQAVHKLIFKLFINKKRNVLFKGNKFRYPIYLFSTVFERECGDGTRLNLRKNVSGSARVL
jgi:hypothetical protein